MARTHRFATPEGEVWLTAETDPRAATDAPFVLVVAGAFAVPRPRIFGLEAHLPEATVACAHLPGNHSPALREHSLAAYARAYDAVLNDVGRPAVVVGASIGGVTSLAMQSRWLKGRILVDPPLVTGKLWPLIAPFRRRLAAAPNDAALRAFLWNLMGLSESEAPGCDYRSLLAGLNGPAWVLCGSQPLMPPRPIAELPSLVDEPERAAFRRLPGVRLEVMEGAGHNLKGRWLQSVAAAARDLLAAGDGRRAPIEGVG